MTTYINRAFIKHFESEVHAAYQRMGSKLRNTVRVKNNVRGAQAVFPVVGAGIARTKARDGTVPVMNPMRSMVEVILSDHYAGDWIDALDELRTNVDEKMIAAQAGAYALGRKTDELIITAMNAKRTYVLGSNKTFGTTPGATGLTKKKVLDAFEILGDGDVPDDGQRYAIVGWHQWSELLNIEEFAHADFVGEDSLPWKGAQAKRWLGTVWMPHSGLPTITRSRNTIRSCFWYHRTAIGHAIGQDITTDITWHGDRAAHFVSSMMSQGAAVIDVKGIVHLECKE